MVAMKTYTVTASRWEHGWELHVAGIGVTQSRTLTSAEEMIREYVSLELDVEPDSFDVAITPKIGGLETDAAELRGEVIELEAAQQHVAQRSRNLVWSLKATGLTSADVAVVLGVSPQRVSQLTRDLAA